MLSQKHMIATLLLAGCGLLNAQQMKKKTGDWNNTSKVLATRCDTLILRENCDYCEGESSLYNPRKFSPTTSCICYSPIYSKEIVSKVKKYMKSHQGEIRVFTIENPSHIIFELEFSKLNKLQTLSLFGDDQDALARLPVELLKLPSLRTLNFSSVSFPSKELETLKKTYPHLQFSGEISEYDPEWDRSQNK